MIGRRGKENLARNLAIYACSRLAGFPHSEIRSYLHLGGDGAVSQTCQRVKASLPRNREVQKIVDWLKSGGV